MKDLGRTAWDVIGKNVFACMYVWPEEDPTVTHWLQRYYNVFITVDTDYPSNPELHAG